MPYALRRPHRLKTVIVYTRRFICRQPEVTLSNATMPPRRYRLFIIVPRCAT